MPDAHRLQDYSPEDRGCDVSSQPGFVVKRTLIARVLKPRPKGSQRQSEIAYNKAESRVKARVDTLNRTYSTKGIRYVFDEDGTHFLIYAEQREGEG